MGAVTFGIPKKLVLLLKESFSVSTFVETGTFKGGTTKWAAGIFQEVYTIEHSRELYEAALKDLGKYRNINALFGSSVLQLRQLLPDLKQPAIFWLDAHWCGGLTYGNEDPCPLLDEIKIIKESHLNHIIMIDDARFFLKPPPRPQNSELWPGLREILGLLNKDDRYFTFVSEDVIVSMPVSGKKALQDYFEEIHTTEFPGGGLISNLRFAFRNIARKWWS